MIHLDKYSGPEPTKRLSDTLMRRGGKMGFGCPIYRLVWSDAVLEMVGGRWHRWDADLNVADRGGITGEDGLPVPSRHRPDEIVVEVRETQTYSHLDAPGWMLERWYPASFFGSPSWWAEQVVTYMENGRKVTTNVPLLGPYPSQGRYLLLSGPFPLQPSISFFEDFIGDWEQRRASFPQDVEQHIKMRVEEAMKREDARSEGAMAENHRRLVDSTSQLTSTTLEAGRWRQQQFEKSGHTSHIGN